jgi:hypothetical protein
VGWPGKGLDHLAPVERLAKPGRCGDARRRTAHTFRGPGQCARESCGGAPSSWGEWRQTPRPSFVDEPAPVLAPARDGRRYLATHRVRSAHPGSDRRARARVEVLGVECRYFGLAAGDRAAQFGVVEKRSASAFVADLGRFALGIQLVRCPSVPSIAGSGTFSIRACSLSKRNACPRLDAPVTAARIARP